jgi:hypothetical protein
LQLTCHDEGMTDEVRGHQIATAQRLGILAVLVEAIAHRQRLFEVVAASANADVARAALRVEFGWSEVGSRAVLDMQVRRFSALERQRLAEEFDQLDKRFTVSVQIGFPEVHDASDRAWLAGAAESCGGMISRPHAVSGPPQGQARFQDVTGAEDFIEVLMADSRFTAWVED